MILKICSVAFSALIGVAALGGGMGVGRAFLVFILSVPASMIGWKIGKAIRDFADPLFVSSNSIVGLAMEKFNALYGTQITGFIFGLLIPFGIFHSDFEASQKWLNLSKKEIAEILDVEMIPVQGGYYNASRINKGADEFNRTTLEVGDDIIVSIPTFAISKLPVSKGLVEVLHGETIIDTSAKNVLYGGNFAEVIVICNELSVKNKFKPCYTFNGTTNTEKWFQNRKKEDVYDEILDSVTCDFSANGYRLPTEMELEYAYFGGRPSVYKLHDYLTNFLGIKEFGHLCWNWYTKDIEIYETDITAPKSPDTNAARTFVVFGGRMGSTRDSSKSGDFSLCRTISNSEMKKMKAIQQKENEKILALLPKMENINGGTFEKRDVKNHTSQEVTVGNFSISKENFPQALKDLGYSYNKKSLNAFSIMSGLQPYYYTDYAFPDDYYGTKSEDCENVGVDGFRFPTEDELAYFDYKYGKDDTREKRIVRSR